jgi:non-ribosomal peptide synthetase-like protein
MSMVRPASKLRSDHALLHDYFVLQARERPHHIAIECDRLKYTYKRLDRASNQIGHWLQAHGASRGSLVGICMAKSFALYAAILGVLKAGAAYVPIDPDLPEDRLQCILDDAAITIIIGSADRTVRLSDGRARMVLSLDGNATQVRSEPHAPLQTNATAADACYVIYTSGSTGKPKGVVIEHRNAVNFVRSLKEIYKLTESDRVYQGFSVGFDASVEEIWAAFSIGGTLVVPPHQQTKSPFETAEFLTDNRITFFSTVPTFLTMIDAELPSVRLLVVGGEQCPAELVARWAPGRRMLNTYGPTETTVVATAAECASGKPVTIGRALPGYFALVLNDRFEPARAGETGELFIGGGSVARGYMNQPELNAGRFIELPSREGEGVPCRLFRTHDMVLIAADGELQFVGRNDQQVKIRGFRVELSEIEAVLLEDPSVRGAAVKVFSHGETIELAAYVIPDREIGADDRRRLAALLRRRLPDYMIPRYLDIIDELPTMLSGKVERDRLPQPRMLLSADDRKAIPPRTPTERAIVETFERSFGVSPIFATDDFFRDLGGHSHMAARVVTELRVTLQTPRICVRDLYEHRTASHLAQHLDRLKIDALGASSDERTGGQRADDTPKVVSMIGRWMCALLQAVVILLIYGIIAAPVLFLLLLTIDCLDGGFEWWRAAQSASTFALFVWPAWLATSVVIKWIVIGRYKPGRYPVWGLYYLRWWIVQRFQSISWCGMFVGTPLMSLYYRAMGADVGPNCTICTPFCTAFDLISIGKGTSVGADTHMLGYRVEDGYLVLDRVRIGEECFIGVHCNLGLNVAMGNSARLDDMSMLPDGAVIASGESRRGSPAVPGTVKLPIVAASRQRKWRRAVFGLIHLGLIYAMGYLLLLSLAPGIALVFYCLLKGGPPAAIGSAFVAVPLSCLCWLLIVLLVKKFAIKKIEPGTYSLTSGTYLRIWFLRYLLDNTRHLLTPIYATMLTPSLLRLLGAHIGRRVEISTVMHEIPDLLDLGEESFLADACIVGGLRIHRGWINMTPNKIGARSFVGNSALAPPGGELGENTLIGVLSVPPAKQSRTRDGTRWLGSPSFELPSKAASPHATNLDETRTYQPTAGLVLQRLSMEMLRMLLPASVLAACLILFVETIAVFHSEFSNLAVYLVSPFLTLLLSLICITTAACIKWVLIGVYRPSVNPLWCSYVWRNEIVNGVFESLAANAISPLLGTPFAAPCLRMMGCSIGRWVYLQTTLFSEFDLVRIGDYAALNLGSTIQTHLFEDRVMKADTLAIGEGCSVGNMSVILYGTTMQRGSRLGPLSLLMKGETLLPGTHWHGIPSEQVPGAFTASDRVSAYEVA